MKRLVILGGGTAGTMAANKLRSAISSDELAITVVDADDLHPYQPGYLFLPFDRIRRSQLVRTRHSFISEGIELLVSRIELVDPAARVVHLADGRLLAYDQLIIATGTAPRPDLVPGMLGHHFGETVHEFYTLEGATKLKEAVRHFRGGRFVVHVCEMPIKCPVAPLEFIMLADDWLRRKGIREKTELVYVTPLDGAFTKPIASRELGHALDSRGIHLEPDFAVERVDGEGRHLLSYDGRSIDYDLLVTVPPNMGADWVAASGMGDESNYVPCDQHTMQAEGYKDIWVLGDAGNLRTSKAGSVAHFSVEVFVENYLAAWHGRKPEASFDGHANCFIESGDGKGMLLDFNYDTEPLTGTFPLPAVGPFGLLRETRMNHLGKLAFRWVYWNLLLPGHPIPIPNAMSMMGKKSEGVATSGWSRRRKPSAPATPPRATVGPDAATPAAAASAAEDPASRVRGLVAPAAGARVADTVVVDVERPPVAPTLRPSRVTLPKPSPAEQPKAPTAARQPAAGQPASVAAATYRVTNSTASEVLHQPIIPLF